VDGRRAHPVRRGLLLAGLLLSAGGARPVPTGPPLCQVVASATPESLPGLYTITVETTTAVGGAGPCPPSGYAIVRLESGRVYPWASVGPGRPFVRPGLPWYFRLVWQARSGRTYSVPVRGLTPPFSEVAP
jgi:hypothetical protein